MKIEMHVMLRQCGKTTKLIDEYLKGDAKDSVIIAISDNMKKEIQDKIRKRGVDRDYVNNVCNAHQFVYGFMLGRTVKNIFIDDWLIFADYQKWDVYKKIHELCAVGIEKVFIYTTSNKLYNKQEVENYRLLNTYWDDVEDSPIKDALRGVCLDKELAYNFLGDKDCTIFNTTAMFPMNEKHVNFKKNYSSEERYLIEVCGHLFY